ncbi:hypothetical protein [Dehalogenimonas sp. 4OHTPN]|uniref:CopG family transcriptional regulator n=1 Tax=Dehalogenimonas sp. 4OHTPN TaxID=3166643 RepID=A0AAU8G955_9CHLR
MTNKKLTLEIPEELFNRFFTYLISQSEARRNPTFQEVNAAAEEALTRWLDQAKKATAEKD